MMNFILIPLILILTQISQAQTLNLKPGLYQITSKITVDGKVIDHTAEMKKMMAQQSKAMTPEMLEQMKKLNIQMPTMPDPNNLQICITAEDLTYESVQKSKNEKSCKYKTVNHTSNEINMTFTCKDGSETSSVTKILNDKNYTSYNITKNKKKKTEHTSEMKSEGKWISSKCTKESMNQPKGIF